MRMWTRQVPEVLEEIERYGRYVCKKEYIEQKNGSIADFYLKLYDWYTREAKKYIDIPEELKYPIWLSVDEDMMLQPVENCVILELEVPKDSFMLCNMDGWGYRVNYWYIPLDREDKIKHEEELKKYGIVNEEDLVLTDKGNFYPLLRNKIKASWSRIFTQQAVRKEEAATVWEIKKEWVKGVRRYD